MTKGEDKPRAKANAAKPAPRGGATKGAADRISDDQLDKVSGGLQKAQEQEEKHG